MVVFLIAAEIQTAIVTETGVQVGVGIHFFLTIVVVDQVMGMKM